MPTMKRIEAMVAQARQPGNCSLKAQAAIDMLYGQIHEEVSELNASLKRLDWLRKKAASQPCKLTTELIPPLSNYEAVAVVDCDEISFMWEDPDSMETIEIEEWPVDQAYVYTEDLEALGFRVEHA